MMANGRRLPAVRRGRRGPSMYSRLLHIGLSLFFIVVSLGPSAAQDEKRPRAVAPARKGGDDEDDYRRLFKRPTNTAEYWRAMQFEIDVGKYDLAAVHLRNLLQFKPPDADLVKLAEEVGISAFL